MKKISLLLAVFMLLACFAACSEVPGTDTQPEELTTAVAPESSAEETTEAAVNAKNVLGERDLGGAKITIYANTSNQMWSNDLFTADLNGDVLQSAIFTRNSRITEDYHVEIAELASGERTFTPKLKAVIKAGDTETCQVFCSVLEDAASAAQNGLLRNIRNIGSINLEGQWWNQADNASWSIGGRQYFATGDITTIDDTAIRALFFNKSILKDINEEAPYKTVLDNKWTYEEFFRLVNAAAVDVGNDGMDKNIDVFGFTAQNTAGYMLLMGANEPLARKDAEDMPYLETVENPDRIVDIIDVLTQNMSGNKAVFIGSDSDHFNIFKQNRALFLAQVLSHAKSLRMDYDIDFGLLPMPKYTADQDKYYQFAEGYCSVVIGFPSIITGDLLETAGFVIEAMAVESVETVTPAFYEICLKGRFSTDYESTEMLDIITANVLTDFVDIFGWGGLKGIVKNSIINGNATASMMKSGNNSGKTQMKNTVNAIIALDY